jgi:SNF2 family DNA or RNA helicase
MKGMVKKMLVVAPMRVATTVWPAEKNKWVDFMGFRMVVLHGPKKLQDLYTEADIYVCTPDGYKELVRLDLLRAINAEMLVVDESSYYRHASSQRFKSMRKSVSQFARRVTLTGTPAPNGYLNLWSQAFIMDSGGALEPYVTHFRSKYFTDRGFKFPDWHLNEGADKLIDARLKPLVLRGDAVDHLQMPKLVVNNVVVALSPSARFTYNAMEKRFHAAMEDGTEAAAVTAAVLGTKLRQIANGFVYNTSNSATFIHNAKLLALHSLLAELNGQQALIFYEYREDRDSISDLLGGVPSLSDVSATVGKELIDGFNKGTVQYLLAHPASAGHGINLQDRAQHVVWFGPTWNLEHYIQATARVWRQGNPHERVFVHTIVAEGTLDEKVTAALTAKNATQQALLNSMKRSKAPDPDTIGSVEPTLDTQQVVH